MNGQEFGARLLAWFDAHGRHDLPWQIKRDSYRVWISEIMLQQTQVATVIPYFKRFVGSFPSVQDLAAAELDDVLHHWSGLGYYARARNLHRAARIVRDEHVGQMPEDIDSLMALPGIGRSTAGAILALAGEQRHPILDGNVKRVLTRFAAIEGWPGKTTVSTRLWKLAERYTPSERVGDYTQAIMDLGATLCTRRQPDCQRCPLVGACRAYREGRAGDLPSPRPHKTLPVRATAMLLLRDGEKVLLARRAPTGLWGGLWGLPEVPLEEDLVVWCKRTFQVSVVEEARWPVLRHSFSHFHLDITPVVMRVATAHGAMENTDVAWYNPARPQNVGLAAPVSRLLARFDAEEAGEQDDKTSAMRRIG